MKVFAGGAIVVWEFELKGEETEKMKQKTMQDLKEGKEDERRRRDE